MGKIGPTSYLDVGPPNLGHVELGLKVVKLPGVTLGGILIKPLEPGITLGGTLNHLNLELL